MKMTLRELPVEHYIMENEVEAAVEVLLEALHRGGAGERIDAARHLRERAEAVGPQHLDRSLRVGDGGTAQGLFPAAALPFSVPRGAVPGRGHHGPRGRRRVGACDCRLAHALVLASR